MDANNTTVTRCQPILDWHADRVLMAADRNGLLTYKQALWFASILGRRAAFLEDFAGFKSGPYGIDSLQFIDWLGI